MSIVLLRTMTGKSIIGFGQYRDLTIQNLIDTAQHKELLHMYYFLRNIDYNEDIIKQLKIDQVYRIDKKNSKFYNELDRPSFKETHRSDVGEELTHICEEKNKNFFLFKKTFSENNLWKLGENDYFGHGCIYDEDLIYHQFEIFQNQNKFIKKCLEILNSNY